MLNPDPNPKRPTERSVQQTRQSVEVRPMRWVLGVSLVLSIVVVAIAAWWIAN